MSDPDTQVPAKRGDLFIMQTRILSTYFTLSILFYITLDLVMRSPPPMLIGLGDMLETDDTGIIAMQIAGFFAFIVLAIIQAVASKAESEVFSPKAQTSFGMFFVPAGLPTGWKNKWRGVKPDVEISDIVLGQHTDSRMALIRFLVAAFPTSGFIGTVLGIRKSIAPLDELVANSTSMGNISTGLGEVVGGLEIAFNTTLVGLVFFLVGSLVTVLLSTYLRRVHSEMLGA